MKLLTYKNSNGLSPTVCIELTKWCNLKCSYCRSSSSSSELLSGINYEALSNYLQGLKKFGDWRISFTGGEPSYWKNFENIVELVVKLGFTFCLTTNGYSSDHILEKIPQDSWNSGTLKVSIDGNEEVHNSLRGKNAYNKTLKFLLKARKIVPKLFINSVLIVDPKQWAKDFIEDLIQISPDNWTIISPVTDGFWNNELEELNTKNYNNQFLFIKEMSKTKGVTFPISFLDYSNWSKEAQEVVYVNSEGEILFPQKFSKTKHVPKLKINATNKQAPQLTYDKVSSFIQEFGYVR